MEKEKILPEDILTDPNHQFISQSLINIFKDKPSKIDLENALNAMKKEIDKEHIKYYDALINTPDAVQRITDIFSLIKSDDNLDQVFEFLATRLPKEVFEKHEESSMHVTNADRKALNALIRFIKDGCADWNAKEGEPNYIKNKPKAFTANGGNADTVEGHDLFDLYNKSYADVVVGMSDDIIDDMAVHVAVKSDKGDEYESAMIVVEYYINDPKAHVSRIHFKPGRYNIEYKHKFDKSLVVTGDGNSSILIFEEAELRNVIFRDIKFINSELHVKNNVKFDNCTFEDSDVIINGSCNNITNCDFINTVIRAEYGCTKNIITLNRLFKQVKLAGGQNMIINNIVK